MCDIFSSVESAKPPTGYPRQLRPMNNNEPLIPAQRREHLIRLLRAEGVLSVRQLTEHLGVSHMTVRRDIAELEKEGRASSIPGGVQLPGNFRIEPTFTDKARTDTAEKNGIAAGIQTLLEDDMVIYLDAGTTTGALIPHILQRSNMTIVTNDFVIVDRLLTSTTNHVLHTGGRVEAINRSTVGPFAATMLRAINVDIAFISTSSWDLAHGITTPHEGKIEVKHAAMTSAASSILLATSSKYGKYAMYKIASLQEFDTVVSDTHLPESTTTNLRDLGINIRLFDPIADVDAESPVQPSPRTLQ